MSNVLKQFNIKGTVADIVDEEARSELEVQSEFTSALQSDIESQSVNLSEMQSEIDSEAVTISELGSEVESQSAAYSEAIAGLEEDKQDVSSAWKIGTISATFEGVTIGSLSSHIFEIPIPTGQTNIRPIFARSADTSRTLLTMNMYAGTSNITVIMSNQRATAFTNETMTIQVTYAHK